MGAARRRRPMMIAQRHLPKLGSRSFAVYAVGEGWTGALGNGRPHVDVMGHFDDNLGDDQTQIVRSATTTPMYTGKTKAVALGWGHTAILTESNQLLVTGRPYDFSILLRLSRLPKWVRDSYVRQAFDVPDSAKDNGLFGKKLAQYLNPSNLVGHIITYLSNLFPSESTDWATIQQNYMRSTLAPLTLHDAAGRVDDFPTVIACSAGFSAYITKRGHLYTFGSNGYGQCGIGMEIDNVWEPTRVIGSDDEANKNISSGIEQDFPITQVALGLQHGIYLNSEGQVFCWGKGERGQLGQGGAMPFSFSPIIVRKAFYMDSVLSSATETASVGTSGTKKPVYEPIGKVQQISAGMVHSAALTEDNKLLLWGKNVLPSFGTDQPRKAASDGVFPAVMGDVPAQSKIIQIACGSHHTAMLLEDGSVWAIGVSRDTQELIHTPVQLIPAGVVDLPVRQFSAHMDRTTVIGNSGRQVLQAQLYKDPELQEYAAFTPAWLDAIVQEDENARFRELHRCWLHSVAVTD